MWGLGERERERESEQRACSDVMGISRAWSRGGGGVVGVCRVLFSIAFLHCLPLSICLEATCFEGGEVVFSQV